MKQIRITRKGVYDQKGERIPVGTVLKVKDDFKGYANKWEAVTPATEGMELQTGEKADQLEKLQAAYKEKTGKDADSRWGIPKLKSELEA